MVFIFVLSMSNKLVKTLIIIHLIMAIMTIGKIDMKEKLGNNVINL